MASRGARKETLPLRWLSRSSTLTTHYQERGVTCCVFRTHSPSSGPNLAKNTSVGIDAFWRRIVDEPDAFPLEFWELFLHLIKPHAP